MADDDSMRRADADDYVTRAGLVAGGKVFGRYVLEAVAGRGGMGVVWKARDERLERLVALKFLPEVVAGDPEAVRDLLRETKRCLELTHPNVVRVHDLVQDGLLAAISMEYVAGESLAKRKAEAPGGCLTVEELAPLVAQLCAALDYAHGEAKVVHRDLKPANLLVTGDGKVKVTDFGIARSLTDTHTRLTGRVGATSGTLAYMSPQQVMGKKATLADDIYALGATLYELLTGKPPFYTGDITHQILQQAPASLAARRAELEVKGGPVPSVWEETILACLAKEPQDRPQSAGEVAARLGLARGEVEGAKAKGENQVGRVDERGRERVETPASRMRWFVLVAAAAIVLGVAGYLFWPRGAGPAAAASRPAEKSSVTQEPSAKPLETVPPVVRPAAALPREFTVTVDPADAGARLWLGPVSDVEVKDGRAVLKDLPDGEQELVVQAPGYQPFTTRVTVKDGRGSVEARLVAVHGTVAVTARPGTQVTAVDEHGRETQLGAVPAGGVLDVENLLNLGRYTLRLEHADCAAVTVPGVELVLGRTAKVAPAQTLLPGELRVFSVPTGAEVRVDGVVAGTTPATIKSQPSEQALRLEVFLRGYRRVEQAVTLQPKEVRSVNVGTLTAENGSLELRLTNAEVRMADLAIRIDGRTVNAGPALAAAPFRLDGLEVGSRTVEIVHPDYEPWRQAVTVRDQEMTAVNVELKPKPGTVACETTPAGVRVVINGGDRHNITLIDDRTQAERLTPLRVALPPGEYTLRFELKGYKAAARTVSVAANRTVEVSASLEKQVLPGPSQGQTWTVRDLNLEMAYIRPGTFTMGSPASESGRSSDEGPQTQVTLTEGYWLGKTEVTQAQWEALMESIPSKFMGPDRPVEQVFWSDAMEFCRKLTERERSAGRLPEGYEYTLPTEAQWEYACRAGTTGQYGGDGNLDDMGWYRQNSGNTTHPVGQKQANAWGLYDMHGNVWEWCLDWYGNYPGGSVRDPTGPASGTGRVGRGGGWGSYAIGCRSAFRSGGVSGYRFNGLGFRLALAPQVNQPATVAANHTAEVSASSEKFRGAEEDQRATEPELDQRFKEMAAQYRASPQKPLPDKISRCDVLAKTAILTKDYDRAIDIYEDGLKEMPTWAVGHFNVAILLGNSKSYNSAILHMKMYLELEPNAPDALSAQDQIYIWEQKTSKH
ncbi:MAG: SUMF1/EgtB/PvdO family nonheme iron enzyme [Opitutaceae bacterium]|jgi:formylglycine-generating enzyme required for sulfatase activity